MAATTTYKLVLVGDGGCGKTAYSKKIRTGSFEPKYVATLGVEVHPIKFQTTNGRSFCFNVWDTAGQDKFGGLRDSYYLKADCAINMFDLTQEVTTSTFRWKGDVKEVLARKGKEIPVLIIGNKRDLVPFPYSDHGPCLSTKEDSVTQLLHPFLILARLLTKDPTLELAPPAPAQPKLSYKAFFP